MYEKIAFSFNLNIISAFSKVSVCSVSIFLCLHQYTHLTTVAIDFIGRIGPMTIKIRENNAES